MTKNFNELIFISQINRDGSGVSNITESYLDCMKDDYFDLICLSMTERTFIAFNMNVFIVKLKDEPRIKPSNRLR